ncbi:potassium channel family protein [Microlunatus spumicola]|uniref:Potassium channel family protein n=1 Tax=Microlunatus spumicola TaxID=81499 RepID=A0ABP6WHH9_9ACTN
MTPETWKRRGEWPLTVAAVLFLISYSWEVLQPGLADPVVRVLRVVDLLTWGVFVVDYVGQVVLAPARARWVLHHLPDLLVVLLPLLRPLRLLRLLVLLRFIDRGVIRSLQGRVAAYVVCATVLVIYAAALAELQAERGAPGSTIGTFGTAVWWAITTITTVGYGDVYPVTTQGRLVAGVLMVAGVAFLGAVTATLSSWLVSRVQPADAAAAASEAEAGVDRGAEPEPLRAEVDRLRALLDAHRIPRGLPDEVAGATAGTPTP